MMRNNSERNGTSKCFVRVMVRLVNNMHQRRALFRAHGLGTMASGTGTVKRRFSSCQPRRYRSRVESSERFRFPVPACGLCQDKKDQENVPHGDPGLRISRRAWSIMLRTLSLRSSTVLRV